MPRQSHSFAIFTLLIGACFATAANGADRPRFGFNAYYTSDLPPDAAPHLAWRLNAAFTSGVSAFLFEVMVMKPTLLPAGRVDPALGEQLNYSGFRGYRNRLGALLVDALEHEANSLAQNVPQEEFWVRLEVIAGNPRLPLCASPRCEVFGFGKLLPLLLPKEYTPPVPAADPLLSLLYTTLDSFEVQALLQPTDEEAQAITNFGRHVISATFKCRRERGCEREL